MESLSSAAPLLLLLFTLADGQPPSGSIRSSPGSLVATINSQGLQGSVEFMPDPSGTPKAVLVRTNLRGGRIGEQFKWRLHEFPPEMGDADPCRTDKLGRIFLDMTSTEGLLSPGKEATSVSGLQLSGGGSILGRGLLLRGSETGRVACASIQPSGSRVRTYRARVFQPLAGEVVVRQGVFGTTVDAKLVYANGTRRDSAHRWALLQTTEQETLNGIYSNEAGHCRGIQAVDFLRPVEGDLMRAGREPGAYFSRSFRSLQDAPPLETAQGGLYVVLYIEGTQGEEIMACGRIYAVEPKQASVRFQSGEVSFRQESPYDATLVTVDLRETLGAHSFGVDELPSIARGGEPESEKCPNVDGGTIYNPHRIEPESVPAPGKGSSDQYAVGDLSGKHGGLEPQGRTYRQTYDPSLSLFGVRSILGRALVLYSPEGVPVACANVELSSRRTDTAFATFDNPLQGQVIFRQERDNFNADTSVYLELSHPGAESTRNHPWGIHFGAVAVPAGAYSTSDCRAAGPLFNPYNASRTGPYPCHCSSAWPLRCQMGDISGLLGPIGTIPAYSDPQAPNGTHRVAKYFLTHPHLPLSGPTSIVGRAVVIGEQDFGEQPLSCSNVILQHQP